MKKIFLLLICLNLIFSKLEEETIYDLILNLYKIELDEINKRGTISFVTNSSRTVEIFDESDIEKQIFDSQIFIKDSTVNAKVKCSLWKPKEESIYILCKLQEDLEEDRKYIKLEEYILNYKEKKIKIFSEDYLKLEIVENFTVPILYADKQILDFNDGKNIYELKFNIILFLEDGDSFSIVDTNIPFQNFINIRDNCTIKGDEFICKIDKNNFEGFLLCKEEIFQILIFSEKYGLILQPLIFDVVIKYNMNKENIYVQIKKLLNNAISKNEIIAYETNVTQIFQSATNIFNLNLISQSSLGTSKFNVSLKNIKIISL